MREAQVRFSLFLSFSPSPSSSFATISPSPLLSSPPTRAECMLLRKEADTHLGELRKLQGLAGSSHERANSTEADARRLKAAAAAETARLTSRCAELDAVNSMLRTQLDKAAESEANALKDVQRALDRAEFDNTRLKDKVSELEAKNEVALGRLVALEKDYLTAQDGLHKRDRAVREERQRAELAMQHAEEVRRKLEQEADSLRAELHKERLQTSDVARQHRQEMEELKQDVAERLPRITAAAVERLEAQFAAKLESESNSIKARYDASSERQRRELIEMQATQAEREARQRSMHADEKAELERLKYHAQRLQRRVDELEAENEESLRALRRRVPVSLDDGTNPTSAPLGFGRGSSSSNNPGTGGPSSSRVNMSSYIAEQEDAMAQQTVAVLQAQLGVMKTQLSMALEKDYSARFTPSAAGASNVFHFDCSLPLDDLAS